MTQVHTDHQARRAAGSSNSQEPARRLTALAAGAVLAVAAVAGLHHLYRVGDNLGALMVWDGQLLLWLSALGGGIKLAAWAIKPVVDAGFDAAKARLTETGQALCATAGVIAGGLGMWWTFRGGYSTWWQHIFGESRWSPLLGVGQMLIAVLAGAALFTGGKYLTTLTKEVLTASGLLGERHRSARRGDGAPSHPALLAALIAGGAGLLILTAWLTPQLAPTITGTTVLPAVGAIAMLLVVAVGSNLGWWKGLGGLYIWATDASQKAAATAAVVAILMFSAGGLGLGWFTPATVPQAHAACPPDCGGGGGLDGPPGGGQIFQPPSQGGQQLPDYQGGSYNDGYPALDQNSGISIYNETPGQGVNASAPNNSYPQQAGQNWNTPRFPNDSATPANPNPSGQPGRGLPGQPAQQAPAQQQVPQQQPAQQAPRQPPQQQPAPQQQPQQQESQPPNQSPDQQRINDLTRQLQDQQQQSGQDRQRLDDLTRQLNQQQQSSQKQQNQLPRFPSKDDKRDRDQQDRDKQSGNNDLAALLLGAASTRRRKQGDQQGPDTQALGQDAAQAAQSLPGDVSNYVSDGTNLASSAGQAAQGYGQAAQAGASLASAAQSGAVNPMDAVTVVQGVAQGVQGTADAVNSGSQIVKTAQGQADQIAQAIGDADPQLKDEAQQFTQLNDQVSQVTDLVGQGAQVTSEVSGVVNSVSGMGSGGLPTDAADPTQVLSSQELLDNAPTAALDGVDIDGDKLDDTNALADAYNYRFANQGLLSVDNVQGSSGQQIPETKISVLQALDLSSKTDWVVPQNFLNNFNPANVGDNASAWVPDGVAPPPPVPPEVRQQWAQAIVDSGLRNGIPPEVLAAQLDEESGHWWYPPLWTGFRPYPIPGDDGRGLGQFLPDTWNAVMPEHPVLDRNVPASDPDLLTKDPRTNPLLMIEAQGRYDRQIIDALKNDPQVAALGLTDVQIMLNGYNGGASYRGVLNALANNDGRGYHNKVLQDHLPNFQITPGPPPALGAPR